MQTGVAPQYFMYSILRPWSNVRLANVCANSCPGVLFWVDLDQGNTLDLFDSGIDLVIVVILMLP